MSSTSLSPASAVQVMDPLDEIRQLIRHDLPALPPPQTAPSMLGDFSDMWRWLAAAQHQEQPRLKHPRIAVFFAAHPNNPASLDEARVTLARLKDGSHPVSPLVQAADADLQAYELDLDRQMRDRVPFADAQEAAQAIAYGMMAVQPGIGLLLVSAPGRAADTASRAVRGALAAREEPFDALMRLGGHDIAAMAGAIVAARLAKIPVLLEGDAALAAVEILNALNASAGDHTRNVTALLSEKTALPSPCHGALLLPLLRSVAEVAG